MARSTAAVRDDGRGRRATRPGEIPAAGWRDIAYRVKDEISRDHVSMMAAAIAFYAIFALFPAIAATISIWGLVADPAQIEEQLAGLAANLPEDAAAILTDQAQNVAGTAGGALSFGLIGGLLLALYSASRGMMALIEGLNIAYEEEEKRGFIELNLVALGLTLLVIVVMLVALGLVVVAPILLGVLGLGTAAEVLITVVRWPLLFAIVMFILGLLYTYAPSRERAHRRWVTWGSGIATLLWIIGSIAFSIYVQNFGNYNETYGSIGAVIILLLWLWLSAFLVLLGAEINAEMEHQTAEDTTAGAPRPMGERGAEVADTVARSP